MKRAGLSVRFPVLASENGRSQLSVLLSYCKITVPRFLIVPIFAFFVLMGCAAPLPEGAYAPNVNDRDVQRLVTELQFLSRFMDNPPLPSTIRVGLIRTMELNAAIAGHGVFYFTDGFVKLRDARMTRGVIAHELAHDDLSHVAKKVASSFAVSAIFVFADIYIPGVGNLDRVVNPLITRAYSRTQELEADAHAIKILTRAFISEGLGIDHAQKEARRTVSHALERLKDGQGVTSVNVLSTHPAIDERIERISVAGD